MTGTTPSSDTDQDGAQVRQCTRCGKELNHVPYWYWLFHICEHCSMDSDGRFRDCGTYRKWRYWPEWHFSQCKAVRKHV